MFLFARLYEYLPVNMRTSDRQSPKFELQAPENNLAHVDKGYVVRAYLGSHCRS